MNSPSIPTRAGLSDYLAAERTLLAWIRTGLAMMGFGFVVARFGLFLEELHAARVSPSTLHTGLSLWFGTALITVGVAVNITAGWNHVQLLRRLDRGDTTHAQARAQAVVVAFLLALVGLAMAIYLISVRGMRSTTPQASQEVSNVRSR